MFEKTDSFRACKINLRGCQRFARYLVRIGWSKGPQSYLMCEHCRASIASAGTVDTQVEIDFGELTRELIGAPGRR